MLTLVVSDIFGHTAELDAFVQSLEGKVVVCSPYSFLGDESPKCEKAVYQTFLERLGHDEYAAKVKDYIVTYSPDCIIGFSAGAVAAWRALAATPLKRVQKLLAFYPGQIRHFTQLRPNCHVDIYFPESEPHFDLCAVIEQIKHVAGVNVIRTRYQHGFMNRLSQNYDVDAYRHYARMCSNELTHIKSSLQLRQFEPCL